VPIRSASCCWVSPSWAARRARRSASGGASAGGKAARGARGRGTSGKSRRWLFGDLFRGRRDVFPQRWARRGSARPGYAPVCRNERVSGVCEKPRVRCGAAPTRRSCRWPMMSFATICRVASSLGSTRCCATTHAGSSRSTSTARVGARTRSRCEPRRPPRRAGRGRAVRSVPQKSPLLDQPSVVPSACGSLRDHDSAACRRLDGRRRAGWRPHPRRRRCRAKRSVAREP
jgi:hypothetical protein